MVPDMPDYTISRVGLNINGEKGSGKTELMWLLKHIIDPMAVGYNNMPDNKGDLIQALISSAVVAVDNISAITEELSDLLCGAANPRGTMVQKRRLFTNKDLVSISIKRFVMMTGISSVIRKTDLADRFIFLDLQRIDEKTRRSVVDMNAELEPSMPIIMGGCFKVLADAMKIYPTYRPIENSRMPDFDRWGYCIAEAIDPGHGGERFKRIYKKLRVERDIGMLSEGLVSQAILSIMERGGEIRSQTMSELQASLKHELMEYHGVTKLMLEKDFPNHRGEFQKELQSIKSNLDEAGYELKLKKKCRSVEDKSTSKFFVSVTRKVKGDNL
jgi:hypothetical protein